MGGPIEASRCIGAGDGDVAEPRTLALLRQARRAGAGVRTRAVDDTVGTRVDDTVCEDEHTVSMLWAKLVIESSGRTK